MREFFVEMFNNDLQNIYQDGEAHRNIATKKRKEQNKEHDEFWSSLNDDQKNKFRTFELVLAEENIQFQEDIYIFALKKGIAIDVTVGSTIK